MKAFLKEIWITDRVRLLWILLLNVFSAFMGSIGIVMLIPMLNLLEGAGSKYTLLQSAINPFFSMSYFQQILTLMGVYLSLLILKAIVNRDLAIRQSVFLEQHGLQMRNRLYEAMTGADWETISNLRSADFMDLFANQCGSYGRGVTMVVELFSSVIMAAMQLVIACFLSLPVTLLVLVFGFIFLCFFSPLIKKSRKYGKEVIAINRDFFAELYEQMGSMKEIRAYGIEKENAIRFETISQRFFDSHLQYIYMSMKPQICYSIGAALLIATIILFNTVVTKTGTAQMIILVYIFARLWPAFSSWQKKIQDIQMAIPAYESVTQTYKSLMKNQCHRTSSQNQLLFSESVVFKDISFTYKNATEAVLKQVSFQMEHGSVTALIGRSGVGKTTTADLLLGLLKPTSGQILIDGSPITEENINAWRKLVGYVPQEPLILNTSIRENLRRFHPDATEEDMISALKKTSAWPFVKKMEQGLDTILGERGVRLSGGERQRIVLARVIMGNPRVLILDEATSALDYESEAAIREAIEALRGDVTILIIAHRLATIRTADYGVVLEDGTVIESGTLQTLLGKADSYLGKMLLME